MAKHTIIVTQRCNLRCRYCYVEKSAATMSERIAGLAVDFAFEHTPADETVDVGYFGGEPLLELGLIAHITARIKSHPAYGRDRVVLSLISNGTRYSDAIGDFLEEQEIHLCVSCDGPPEIQNLARRFRGGRPTSAVVEKNVRRAAERFPDLQVNAVFGPASLHHLAGSVDYLAALGVTQIHLNPDYTAAWSADDLAALPDVYSQVGETYMRHRRSGRPLFVSLIDGKIAAILRGGYQPGETCRMGQGEFAYAPAGWIYPCERLIRAGNGGVHCVGHVETGLAPSRASCGRTCATNPECACCGLQAYCMRWCGCSNFLSSGRYDRASPFLCASERAAIRTAFDVFCRIEERHGPAFFDHVSGLVHADSLAARAPVDAARRARPQPIRFIHRHEGEPSHG